MIQLIFRIVKFLLIVSLLLLHQLGFSQYEIPKKPSFIPPIIDSTKTLSDSEIKNLYEKLRIYSDSTSTEIFVMIVSTTQGQDVSKYGLFVYINLPSRVSCLLGLMVIVGMLTLFRKPV